MKNYMYLILLIAIIFNTSCAKEDKSNFTLKGSIKGLKKGIIYLQKDGDSTLIDLDSMEIKGQPEFELRTNLEEPILLYLSLSKKDGKDHYIPFFASEGETYISTTLENFSFEADIKGSKQQ
ncbi:MAG: DUF4369 domain-containing protein, partial [Bacteroidota bacterium]